MRLPLNRGVMGRRVPVGASGPSTVSPVCVLIEPAGQSVTGRLSLSVKPQ